ncbi:hypothetical protein ABK040_001446 [Willaertia magna]
MFERRTIALINKNIDNSKQQTFLKINEQEKKQFTTLLNHNLQELLSSSSPSSPVSLLTSDKFNNNKQNQQSNNNYNNNNNWFDTYGLFLPLPLDFITSNNFENNSLWKISNEMSQSFCQLHIPIIKQKQQFVEEEKKEQEEDEYIEKNNKEQYEKKKKITIQLLKDLEINKALIILNEILNNNLSNNTNNYVNNYINNGENNSLNNKVSYINMERIYIIEVMIVCYLIQGQLEKALIVIEELEQEFGKELEQEKEDKKEDDDKKGLKRDYIYFYLNSLIYFLLKDFNKSISFCEKSIQLMLKNHKDDEEDEENEEDEEESIPVRMQPLMLYGWLLYELLEYEYAEQLFESCCREYFPYNAEVYYNYAQLLYCIHHHNDSNNKEKVEFYMRRSVEFYLNRSLMLRQSRAKKKAEKMGNEKEEEERKMVLSTSNLQSRFYSIFKYYNYYLFVLERNGREDELIKQVRFCEEFCYSLLKRKFNLIITTTTSKKNNNKNSNNNDTNNNNNSNETTTKTIKDEGRTKIIIQQREDKDNNINNNNKKENENTFLSINHPIEIAYLLLLCARYYSFHKSNLTRQKSIILYEIASELELYCYQYFNNEVNITGSSNSSCGSINNLKFFCKKIRVTEIFSITKERKLMLQQQQNSNSNIENSNNNENIKDNNNNNALSSPKKYSLNKNFKT